MTFLINQRYVNMYVLDVLSSFNYVEISMMLRNEWKVLNWFEESESVLQLEFNYAKKNDEISCWLIHGIWGKHDLQGIEI
jgi:hypothetical protein